MSRRYLIILCATLIAASASAGSPELTDVPDLDASTAFIDPAAEGANVYCAPDGHGDPLSEARLPGGEVVDATITLTLVNNQGEPIFNYPFEDMFIATSGAGLVTCVNGANADASTDINGQTEWSNPIRGGGSSLGETVKVYVAGVALPNVDIDLTFNSADMNGDLLVDLIDIVLFTQALATNDPRGDFNFDGVIDLSEIVRFTRRIGADCD
jgi:hypothetical protein